LHHKKFRILRSFLIHPAYYNIYGITASDDSCVRGGLHGYEDTGHAREKPNLPICACEIGDLEIIILV